jgi:chorismate mutase
VSESLLKLRKNVERIDAQMVLLLKKRMLLVKEIGNLKKELGMDLIDSVRERQVLDHVVSLPHDPIPTRILEDLFLQIIRVSRDVQIPQSASSPKEHS